MLDGLQRLSQTRGSSFGTNLYVSSICLSSVSSLVQLDLYRNYEKPCSAFKLDRLLTNLRSKFTARYTKYTRS